MTNRRYSSRLAVSIPTITMKVFKGERLTAYMNTSLVFTNICQKWTCWKEGEKHKSTFEIVTHHFTELHLFFWMNTEMIFIMNRKVAFDTGFITTCCHAIDRRNFP